MRVDAHRDFRLLTEISSEVSVTQRQLARKFGLALGLTNFLIHRLIRKGYVKVINLERNRLRYLLTPKGVAAKARLTYQYLEYSLHLYRATRTFVAQVLSAIMESGRTRTVLVGTGEVAEIAFLILQQHGVRVVAVMEESLDGRRLFMNQPVRTLEELPRLSYDWIVIASFKDSRVILQRLAAWGVPKERIVRIPDTDQEPSAYPAPAEAMRDSLVTSMGRPL